MSATTTALTETIPRPNVDETIQQKPYEYNTAMTSKAQLPTPLNERNSVHSDHHRPGSKAASFMSQTGRITGQERSLDSNAGEGGVDAVTPAMRRREKAVIAAMCFALFLAGWNDGTTGPLLPRIQRVYGVNFAVVSIIFISNCLGFISGALANVFWTDRYPFGSLIIGASICQVVAYSIQSAAPPFPLLCIAYALNGFGISIQDAQANGLVASVHEHASEKMGLLHAIYGVGAFAAPLVATQFAQLRRWSFHFLVSLGIAVVNTVVLVLTVKNKSLENILRSIGSPPAETHADEQPPNIEMSSLENTNAAEAKTDATKPSSMNQILKNVTVQLMAIFILVYVGVEVTIGGWIVTYLIDVRGGGPSSGYASSGFFGGLTFGRIALLWVNRVVGERRVVFIYAALAIGFELVIWLVPSLVGNAVAVSIIGILLGPMYPLCMNHAGRVLPRRILTGSIGWMAGFGQAGSAVIPFMTGALANRFGIKSLQPLLVAMMGLMTALWAVIPNHAKRRD